MRRPSQAARAARESRTRRKSFARVADEDDEDGAREGRSMRLLERHHSGGSSPSPVPEAGGRRPDILQDLDTPTQKEDKRLGYDPEATPRKRTPTPIVTDARPPRSRSTTPPPHSAASEASTVTDPFKSPTKLSKHMSRFVEDLPSQSPTKERSSDQFARPAASGAAQGSGLTPTSATFSDPSSTPRQSIDDFLLPAQHGASASEPSPGVSSLRNPFTDDSAEPLAASTPPARAFHSALNGTARQPKPTAKMRGWGSADDGEYGLGSGAGDEELRDADTSGTVGILDWILCGCFRHVDDKEGEQAGRTNPME